MNSFLMKQSLRRYVLQIQFMFHAIMTSHIFTATLSLLLLTAGLIHADQQQEQNDFDGCDTDFVMTECEDGQEEVVVLGHKSPDTDAVSAAIVRAWELRTGPEAICAMLYVNTDGINRETEFVLEYFDIDVPPTISELAVGDVTFQKFAVVDTNNVEELPDDAGSASETYLHSVVDHHRITGTLWSDKPVEFDVRVLASTGSVLYHRFMAEGRTIPGAGCSVNVAGLMIATILSDSLVFRSPTTTKRDVDAVEALAPLAGIDDYRAFGQLMLDAKSNITGKTAEELVVLDSKQVEADTKDGGEVVLRVSVFETVLSDEVLDMANEIAAACDSQLLKDQWEAENAVAVLFFVINVRDQKAIYIPSSNEFATKLVLNGRFQMAGPDGKLSVPPEYVEVRQNDTGIIELPTVLSRKKQIMPALLKSLENTPYNGNMAEEVDCMEFGNGIMKCHGEVMVEAVSPKSSKADIDVSSEEIILDDSSSGDRTGVAKLMTSFLFLFVVVINVS